jgi:hypothetical protein
MFQRLLPLLLAVAGCLPAADQIAFVAGTQYAVESDTSVPLTLVRNGDLAGRRRQRGQDHLHPAAR